MEEPLPPLTPQEYEAIRAVLDTVDRAGSDDNVDIEALLDRLGMKDATEIIAVMRAYAEGYEAADSD